jgi:hypothetical protein
MSYTVVWFVARIGKEQVAAYQYTVTKFTPHSELKLKMFYVSTFWLQRQDILRNT